MYDDVTMTNCVVLYTWNFLRGQITSVFAKIFDVRTFVPTLWMIKQNVIKIKQHIQDQIQLKKQSVLSLTSDLQFLPFP